MIEDKFMTKRAFSDLVLARVLKTRSTFMDAVIDLCKQYEIELENSRKFLSNKVKERIECEAKDLNYLPKENQLPV
jgi:hypothetical protein